ncbi:hypothetical protein [Phenylobacterium sp.]|uniref:hypothetical protein n=1 Tax=Phenylobacterium sp. TaxID=1871053 RepID=UPI0011FC2E35|nr:hypothetical protein [Phenylobacterium sp.]THD60076.1 MAG: hypothetical protein E8A49_14850 [Phenylobacterium sp.]
MALGLEDIDVEGDSPDRAVEPDGIVPGVWPAPVAVAPTPGALPGEAAPGCPVAADAEPAAVCAIAGIAMTLAKVIPKIKVLRMSLSYV